MSEPSTRFMEERVNGLRNLILAVMFVILAAGFSTASDIYIAQNAAGGNSGADCADAHAVAWFNNSANWGSGAGQIGPGTTVHLCGTISTNLAAQRSGSNGNPITIFFESGANITSACGGGGCLSTKSLAYIIVDGGSTCGWINQTQVSCNGTIQSSTASPSGSQFGIEATGCANCEFRNLNIGPIFVTTANGVQASGDIRGIQFLPSAGTGTALVHNNIVHDAASGIVYVPNGSNDNGFQAYNNSEYNINSSVDISNNNSGMLTAALIHDNHFGSTGNWDNAGCPEHHNSLHAFAYTTTNSGIKYYNNFIDGNWGTCSTGGLFIEGSGSLNYNVAAFNNIWAMQYPSNSGNMANGIVNITAGGFIKFYNNTVIGSNGNGDNCVALNALTSDSTNIYIENNIISGCNGQTLFSNTGLNYFTTVNNNVYGGSSSSTPFAVNCGSSGCNYYGYSQWKSACSCDASSFFNSSYSYWNGNSSTGQLNSGSPAINAGANLTDLGIAALSLDHDGNPRPSSGAWTSGALDYSSVSSIAPPTGLAALVQ
jgi:hypothetical protein